MKIERPVALSLSFQGLCCSIDRNSLTNGLVAAIFAVTGPVAIILSVASSAGLEKTIINTWVFAAFGIGGLLTLVLSYLYRQPLAMAWTMPGAALLVSSLDHLTFSEAVGAFLVSGLLMVLLGVSGLARWLMNKFPGNIVMAMVAGVFLPFGLNLISGFENTPLISGAAILGYVVASVFSRIGRYAPPMLSALIAGIIVAVLVGKGPVLPEQMSWIATPTIITPTFSIDAMIELVIPLVISVIAVQNIQGVSILKTVGYEAPIDVLTIVCGYGSLVMGILGCVPTCVTGPANAILVSSGKKGTHYLGAMLFGFLFALVGLFSPLLIETATSMPLDFILVLGGLAMLPVLTSAFCAAFSFQRSSKLSDFAAVVTFLVTVSDISIFNIAAPFWGLVFGYMIYLSSNFLTVK